MRGKLLYAEMPNSMKLACKPIFAQTINLGGGKIMEFGYEHAARTFAYQQKAWFGRDSEVFFNGKYWVVEVK